MIVAVTVPAVGESISTGVISSWYKKNGDQIIAGDLLFTLETDKVSSEVTALESGTLKITVSEGSEVAIGSTVAEIDTTLQTIPTQTEEQLKTPNTENTHHSNREVSSSQPHLPISEPHFSTPRSNSSGRVTRKKLSPLRRKIALQLVHAQQTAAILTTFNEVDMTAIIKLRNALQDNFHAKYGVKLGFMSFFIKAVVEALQSIPQINAQLDGDELIEQHYYDIGVAVGTEKGLIVPVLRDCEKLSFAKLEKTLRDFSTKARKGMIELADLQGGVFTISNGGVYGSLLSTPILNPPQSGILGMHTIQERPVAIHGKVEIRPMMYLALSYDHRVVDGKEAVSFLIKIKETLENPIRLCLTCLNSDDIEKSLE